MKVTEAGCESLPDWLDFNADNLTLYGIATVLDIGYHYISVTTTSENNKVSRNNDIFTIDVMMDISLTADKLSDHLPERARNKLTDILLLNLQSSDVLTYETRLESCSPDQPRYSATIIFDSTFKELGGQARVDVALRFAEFVSRSPVDITLSPRKSTSITRLLKKSIVAAGAGDVDDKHMEENVEISWTIACNYQFRIKDFIMILEHNILSKTLTNVIGYSILGWYITKEAPRFKPRIRRQANGIIEGTPMPTPSLTIVPPTNVGSTRTFTFPSTSIFSESTFTIETIPSMFTQTIFASQDSQPLISSFSTSDQTSYISFSSSDSIVYSTLFTSESVLLSTTNLIMTSTLHISTLESFFSESVSTYSVPQLTSSTARSNQFSSTFITSSLSEPYFTMTISPVELSSSLARSSFESFSETSSSTSFQYLSSVESSFSFYFSTSMARDSMATVVPFSTDSLSISPVVSTVTLTTDVMPSTSQKSSQMLTQLESDSLSTVIVSTAETTSLDISLDLSSVITHQPLSSTELNLYSSTLITSSDLFSVMSSSVDDSFVTSSVLKESSILVSSVSTILSSSFEASVPVFSSSLSQTFYSLQPSSSLLPSMTPSASSQQIMSSSELYSMKSSFSILSSELSPSISETSFFISSINIETQSVSPTSSVLLSEPTPSSSATPQPSVSQPLTPQPSVPQTLTPLISTPQSSVPQTLTPLISTYHLSTSTTSFSTSSSLMPSSTFLTPSPSYFPSSVMESSLPTVVPTPTLSTSIMGSLSSISVSSIQQVLSSDIIPSSSISNTIISSSLYVITPEPTNQGPVVLNAINHVSIIIGRILHFDIPADTFHDAEDGNTRNLKLELLAGDNEPLQGSSWVRLDSENQVIYGLPLDFDLIGQKIVYNLHAIDTNGLNVFDALYLEVLPDPFIYNHRFFITFSNNYFGFASYVNNAINVCQRLADYYGDPNTDMITVASVTEGSVIYAYANNSIAKDFCDKDTVYNVYSRLAYANGSVNIGLSIVMHPKFSVIAVDKEFTGICLPKPQTTNSPNVIAEKHTSEGDIIPIIVPALLSALIILLIGICVCFCYKRKRHGEEFLLPEETNMFVGNRKPIFLDNELQKQAKAAEPVILPKDISPFQASPISVNYPLEGRPSPPSYLNEAYEKDDIDLGIPMAPLFMPPAYSPQPTFNRPPPSYMDPPTYRLPPPYESEDVGIFETSKI
ncbi:uncharacterized protein [Antedon mediterranea]|uniref:uncharacterized protein n=1 Tax=Antedon mediterranea TaxID=105859 RepID=UPI003AF696C6